MREKVRASMSYRRGAPADRNKVFQKWRDAERIDVREDAVVEIGGREYGKTTVVFYVPASSGNSGG